MTETRSRLRLIVIQALVLSLFATLLVRLYYLQVVGGDQYARAAASQTMREIVEQPQRGLIVDDEGRPLVANRTAWVVAVDRNTLAAMSAADQRTVLHRVSGVTHVGVPRLHRMLTSCGDPGAVPDLCWNGTALQPVPVAEDVAQPVALRIQEQPEDFPGVVAEQQSVRAYPRPYGVNLAHVLGYLSPITRSELARAHRQDDQTLDASSEVGRAGVEKEYDTWLRGVPGYQRVAVDSMGRPLGEESTVPAQPGDTLVTSIDAKVQGVVERQLAQTIATARQTYDPVTHMNYRADSGAAIVLDAHTGRVVAMASQPTYDPSVWVGGISQTELSKLESAQAGTPLLSRATQGEFAPGSTWKPVMTVGAFGDGYGPNSRLDCSSGFRVGNRTFKNYESESYGSIDFAKALQISCDTFFYRVGYAFWAKYGQDETDVNARDPLVAEAKDFGFGKPTGIDLPAESAGRIADRRWKLAYWRQMRGYYCRLDRAGTAQSAYLKLFAHEFCLEGNHYRAGDAVNFAIGQGDTLVTPLQLARAYAALANGGTLFEPRVAKAVVAPDGTVVRRFSPVVAGHVPATAATLRYVDQALLGTPETGTLAWKFVGFPLDQVQVRGKTGSAEVYGKQSTSWVATYDQDYVVVMMVSQGGTGSGTSGPAVRAIWDALYGIDDPGATGAAGTATVDTANAAIPGVTPPAGLPTFTRDGAILPPAREPTSEPTREPAREEDQ